MRALVLALSLVACTPEAPEPPLEEGPVELPTGGCGLASYDLQPPEELGRIVAYERVEEASLTATEVALLVAGAGVGGQIPARHGFDVWRIRYLTQDRGELLETTGVIALPDVDEPTTFPTLLWVRPTVGFSDDCAPSGKGFPDILGQALLASLGFAVVAPDLLGMNGWGEPAPFLHPYVVPEPTALASLDAVRALWRFLEDEGPPDLEVSAEARSVFWGASEGGFGALWADRYATAYAPEIDVAAVVAAVPPTDLLGLATEAVSSWGPPSEALAGILATSRLWYGEPAPLGDLLTDEAPGFLASTLEETLAGLCSVSSNTVEALGAVEAVYQPAFIEGLSGPEPRAPEPWQCMLERGTLRLSEVPRGHDAPVLFVVGEEDELVVGRVEREDAPRLCELGYDLDYLECAGADHVEAAADTLPHQIDWVERRLAGEPVAAPCTFPGPQPCGG